MLQALSEHGKEVILATLAKNDINQLRKTTRFYCPACKQEVLIKAGSHVIPHFAHQSTKRCHTHHIGEGYYHEQGKLQLYQWLQSLGYKPNLEVYLREISQRPDIFLSINKKHIALEYQCATISSEEFRHRNLGYQRIGITPIWILGGNRLQRKRNQQLKINANTRLFIHQFKQEHPTKLFFYCSNSKQFLRVNDLYFSNQTSAFAHFQFSSLDKLSLQSMLLNTFVDKQELYRKWEKEKYRFRLYGGRGVGKQAGQWLTWLYKHQTSIEHLPSVVFLPVPHAHVINRPLWDWQSRICLSIIEPLPIGACFSLTACKNLLNPHEILSGASPIYAYLQILITLGLLQEKTHGIYEKIKPLQFHQHVEQAVYADRSLMHYLRTLERNTKHDSQENSHTI
ncbi:competence protein CoiA family protein [Virgibacillus sp. LDC-1]|uniref:competence protein CoiA n=1 Tax=Virgibacillus sp. LDC-1 TaxID=3039856 RepID=UPI0024DE8279|nr:competence protein CoiA family protein [Virgibacillus sp. LDC-1]